MHQTAHHEGPQLFCDLTLTLIRVIHRHEVALTSVGPQPPRHPQEWMKLLDAVDKRSGSHYDGVPCMLRQQHRMLRPIRLVVTSVVALIRHKHSLLCRNVFGQRPQAPLLQVGVGTDEHIILVGIEGAFLADDEGTQVGEPGQLPLPQHAERCRAYHHGLVLLRSKMRPHCDGLSQPHVIAEKHAATIDGASVDELKPLGLPRVKGFLEKVELDLCSLIILEEMRVSLHQGSIGCNLRVVPRSECIIDDDLVELASSGQLEAMKWLEQSQDLLCRQQVARDQFLQLAIGKMLDLTKKIILSSLVVLLLEIIRQGLRRSRPPDGDAVPSFDANLDETALCLGQGAQRDG